MSTARIAQIAIEALAQCARVLEARAATLRREAFSPLQMDRGAVHILAWHCEDDAQGINELVARLRDELDKAG